MIARAELAQVLDSTLSDTEVVERVRGGEEGLFEILMRRYNERIFRVACSIVQDAREAEDIMQDTYVRAYTHLDQWKGEAPFATWLTKISVHESLARARKRGRFVALDDLEGPQHHPWNHLSHASSTPEDEISNDELRVLLESVVANLPDSHRIVFVLREVEGLKTAEAAACLGISPESVRVRLHRARAILRRDIDRRLGEETRRLYGFHLSRCDRVVEGAFRRIEKIYSTDR